MAIAVGALALPSAVLAFSSRLDVLPAGLTASQGVASFAPGQMDSRLVHAIAPRPQGKGALFGFTPAGLATRPDRSVTVAVRVDDETARAITVRGISPSISRPSAGVPILRIAPTAYNLGIARGAQGFSQAIQNFALSGDSHRIDMPDLSTYASADQSHAVAAPRLAPRISLDEHDRAGRSPRTLEGMGEQSVDLGGSYSITRNIDVTAGVRYSQDRDRLKPLTDGKTDNQAVFVGTQFHF